MINPRRIKSPTTNTEGEKDEKAAGKDWKRLELKEIKRATKGCGPPLESNSGPGFVHKWWERVQKRRDFVARRHPGVGRKKGRLK